jgi:hypothetical protein
MADTRCDCPVGSGEGAWRETHAPTCATQADTRTVREVAAAESPNWTDQAKLLAAFGVDPDMPFEQFEVVTPEMRAVLDAALQWRAKAHDTANYTATSVLVQALDAYALAIKGDDR